MAPVAIITQWSFYHRRESTNSQQYDVDRRIHLSKTANGYDDLENFLTNYKSVNDKVGTVPVVHSEIPPARWFSRDRIDQFWEIFKGADWPLDPPKTLQEYELLPDAIQTELSDLKIDGVRSFKEYLGVIQFYSERSVNILGENHLIVEQIDYSRDHYHYGLKTAEKFVSHDRPA